MILGYFFVTWTVEETTNNTRYRLFQIGSDSGIPNMSNGDYVLGDFDLYDSQDPTYGDLVVFSVSNGDSYVYRIVGIPNDTLNIENQIVKYKNRSYNSELISKSIYAEYEMEELLETLPNGIQYKISRNQTPLFEEESNFKEIPVPKDSYFLLGDNRNFSFDSRMIGFVEREQIQGKLLSIYFSKDFNKINKSLSEK